MGDSKEIPFYEKSYHIREEGWGGEENRVSSIAFDVLEGVNPENIEFTHVLKEPRGTNYIDRLAEKNPPKTDEEKQAVKDLSDYFNSREHFLNSQKDYKFMGNIFGNILPEAQFIIGKPSANNPLGFYILQEKIKGVTWTNFSKDKSSEQNNAFILRHREQLIELIGGARKVLVELGATVDIWGNNLMVDENENFVLIDPGSPSELERHLKTLLKLPKGMRVKIAENLQRRIDDLELYPATVKMSAEEINEMHSKFGFDASKYHNAKNKLRERLEQLVK